jgi:anhydro-N-acetylmuramic acid kinase
MTIKPLKILGIMSGTSLDGADLALCHFSYKNNKFDYRLIRAETVAYPQIIKEELKNSMEISSGDLLKLDHSYGKWTGNICNDFLNRIDENADIIASHGHTVFHNPAQFCTLQIGNGHDIASATGISVIYDFRSMDVALGGQGAPLVPIGDKLLFGDYAACLNLGGFSNISYEEKGKRVAFDISPVNIALNYLSERINKEFDTEGESGRSGNLISELYEKLEKISYYASPPPKSLGKEWFERNFKPYIIQGPETKDIMHTVYQHISQRISSVITRLADKNILVTGGGTYNRFLMELIEQKSQCNIMIPDKTLIDFKEAIIFGFLGYLRYNGLNNVLKSVTGAKRDSCGGLLVKP